ncbi:MAG: redoxin domain-containing protein [Planctomycetes bacterium]|nr:redoxin domain-containing protein [Planctomycetota bacterium]
MNDVCDAIQNRLVKLHLTGIPITDDPEVKAHLETCSTCRIYHDFLNHDHRELETYAKSLDTYVDRVRQTLHRKIEHAQPDSPGRSTFPWWATAAAILLVAGLIFLFNGGPGIAPDRPGPDQNTTDTQSPTLQLPAAKTEAVAMERQLARQHLDRRDTTALLGLLNSDHNETRLLAAQYLSQVGDANALPTLKNLARIWDDPNEDNPYAQAIARIEGRSLEPKVVTPEPAPMAVAPSVGRHINPDANGVTLEIFVTEKGTGLPLSEVSVLMPTQGHEELEGLTDVNGACRVGYEETSIPGIGFRVRKAGYVDMGIEVLDLAASASPRRVDFALKPAMVIGGIVQDPNGEAVEGAVVRFYYDEKDVQGWPYVFASCKSTTDTQGRWHFDNMPMKIARLSVHASHLDYADLRISAADPLTAEFTEAMKQALAQQTWVITLDRGKSVAGTLVDNQGDPIASAQIKVSEQDNVQTDAQGNFVITHIPYDQKWMAITVSAVGFPPTQKNIHVESDALPVEIVLDAGVACSGRVVDANGLPLADVAVAADLDRPVYQSQWKVQTDANGIYEIDNLPNQRVDLSFRKTGYMGYTMNVTAEGPLPEVALYPLLNVTGRVVDAEDGRPIEAFRVIHGSCDKRPDKIHWEVSTSNYEQKEGRLRSQFDQAQGGFALLIEADGYELSESRMLLPGEQNVTLNFALVKGEGSQGVVLDSQGKPVPGVQVFVGHENNPVTIKAGVAIDDDQARRRTDAQGQFMLKPRPGVQHVVAIDANGIGSVALADFMESGTIVLEPWASVEGDLYVGTQPAVGHRLKAMQLDEDMDTLGYYGATECVTDENGQFYFPRVPPGHMFLYHHVYPIEPGQHLQLHVGGKGRTVTGQFDVDLPKTIPWNSIAVHIVDLDGSPEETSVKPMHFFWPDPTGRFRHDNLEPGHYAMVGFHNSDWPNRPQRQLCRLWYEFSVPPISDKRQLDIPINLGTISLIPGDLRLGDPAPPFDLVLADKGRVTLEEHQGKLVLLSFYRPEELRTTTESIETIKRIHSQFRQDSRFALIGLLSMADKALQDQTPVDTTDLPWPHALVAETKKNRTHIEYDVLNTPWPWNILISPDGMVLAIGLQGDELLETIEAHLP